jgi:hypothetical protein
MDVQQLKDDAAAGKTSASLRLCAKSLLQRDDAHATRLNRGTLPGNLETHGFFRGKPIFGRTVVKQWHVDSLLSSG